LLPLAALKLSGRHNASNALATLALGDALRLPIAPMLDELREFTGLPHRSQWVADIAQVRYIDDSKGTNVGATLAAVSGLSGPLVLIAGGDGKGQDFTPLAQGFRGKVRTAVLLGRDAGLIETALAGICHSVRVSSMDDAVQAAARFAQAGDTVLLSPACSSLDMFRDNAHRGNVFSAAVKELVKEAQ
jgi:UDP-N-acetylmuramoylalanine--D-glutamate ligase